MLKFCLCSPIFAYKLSHTTELCRVMFTNCCIYTVINPKYLYSKGRKVQKCMLKCASNTMCSHYPAALPENTAASVQNDQISTKSPILDRHCGVFCFIKSSFSFCNWYSQSDCSVIDLSSQQFMNKYFTSANSTYCGNPWPLPEFLLFQGLKNILCLYCMFMWKSILNSFRKPRMSQFPLHSAACWSYTPVSTSLIYLDFPPTSLAAPHSIIRHSAYMPACFLSSLSCLWLLISLSEYYPFMAVYCHWDGLLHKKDLLLKII